MKCPHCSATISRKLITSEAGRLMAKRRKLLAAQGLVTFGRKKVMRPCRFCDTEFSAALMRQHLPRCSKKKIHPHKPGSLTGRKKIMRPCPHCGRAYSVREMREHSSLCHRLKSQSSRS